MGCTVFKLGESFRFNRLPAEGLACFPRKAEGFRHSLLLVGNAMGNRPEQGRVNVEAPSRGPNLKHRTVPRMVSLLTLRGHQVNDVSLLAHLRPQAERGTKLPLRERAAGDRNRARQGHYFRHVGLRSRRKCYSVRRVRGLEPEGHSQTCHLTVRPRGITVLTHKTKLNPKGGFKWLQLVLVG